MQQHENMTSPQSDKYTLKISRLTIEKLGIKLYDKVAAVLSELIANCYDADAEHVTIVLPLDTYLAKKSGDQVEDQGFEITIEDDGHGMAAADVNQHYLPVGINRRTSRGQLSLEKDRRVMGRKGIGKLAPFGICREIEVLSSGGEAGEDGFEVANLILRLDDIVSETDEDYHPEPGPLDGTRRAFRGTTVILRRFDRRRVPSAEILHRQVAARFGIARDDWEVKIVDAADTNSAFTVGSLQIDCLDGTQIDVRERPVEVPEGEPLAVSGWVAYARDPYKDDTMAGVRIFARDKLVAQTRDFGIQSGFTGEFKMRSYLVGAIHANWLDDEEDLIRSDRQDIIWNSERGEALQRWGQALAQELARRAETSLTQRVWDEFLELSHLKERLDRAAPKDARLRDSILRAARVLVRHQDRGAIRDDPEYVESLVSLAFAIGPHRDLLDALREASEASAGTLETVLGLFARAGVAELYSLGQVARERVKSVEQLQGLIRNTQTAERDLQDLIEKAPWILYPDWTPLANNRTLARARTLFEGWYEQRYGVSITTSAMQNPGTRPDFIMLSNEARLEVVEIKRPGHALDDVEVRRAYQYLLDVEKFREENAEIGHAFNTSRLTIVSDAQKFADATSHAVFEDSRVRRLTWYDVLNGTMRAHEDFLDIVRTMQGALPEARDVSSDSTRAEA